MDRLKELLPSEIKRLEILFDKWLSKQIYADTDELIELIEMTIQQIDSVLIKLEFHKQQTKNSNPMDYDEEYILHTTELVKENENQKEYWRYRLNELCTKKVHSSTAKTSYKWQGNPDELPELYNLMMVKYKLIASETTYEQFKAVFTGQTIDDSFKPIRWHQDNASELLYFDDAIKNKVNNVWNIYQRMSACFVKPDGNSFKASWKSLKTNIGINLSTDKQKAIDELVGNF